jgi:hypothetical protein
MVTAGCGESKVSTNERTLDHVYTGVRGYIVAPQIVTVEMKQFKFRTKLQTGELNTMVNMSATRRYSASAWLSTANGR